jgi:hypothetical protein
MKYCIYTDCKEFARYKNKGEKPKYCEKHKTSVMKREHGIICKVDSCDTRAHYGLDGKSTHCAMHKTDGMKISSGLCIEKGCTTQASYGLGSKRTHCVTHKSNDMKSIYGLCQKNGCDKRATYGLNGKNIYCVTHKTSDMKLNQGLCKENGCDRCATYGLDGKNTHCSIHKTNDMKVNHGFCIKNGCNTRASYGLDGKNTHCAIHKTKDMRLNHGICRENGCNKCASHGLNEQSTHCTTHRTKDMKYIYGLCKENGCEKHARYGLDGKNTHCTIHKTENMKYNGKICLSKDCKTIISYNSKYDNYCFQCYCNLFPDKPIVFNYKTKELKVVEYIKNAFSQHNWIFDKRISNKKSKCRPDIFLDFSSYVLIIEVDEHQHKRTRYDVLYEEQRLVQLSEDVSNKPIICIRFNPDSYTKNNKRIKSPWKIDKETHLCNLSNITEWNERLLVLNETIKEQFSKIPENPITIINLFYDEL